MEKKKISIPGTKLSVNNTQLLISSGIPSFDDVIGGGIPVGTITLIEEDTCALYSSLMIQYYLAEGVVTGHSAFVGSHEFNVSALISGLPSVIIPNEEPSLQPVSDEEKLKIAWRYQNVPTSQPAATKKFGHFYDLSKVMDKSYMDNADIKCWSSGKFNFLTQTFLNPVYHELLEAIKKEIDDGGFSLSSQQPKRSILRIVLQSLGSPLWIPNGYSARMSQKKDLEIFIFCLRALVRSALAVVVITMPSKIIDEDTVSRCIHSSDIVVRLQSFSGTELENNNALSDYQGFFHIVKLPAINTLQPIDVGSLDFTFKLRRKKFSIEELHLPPELQDSSEREQDEISSMACGNPSKHLYEF